MNDHFVEELGVSLAWGRALKTVASPGRKEIGPLTVAITGANAEKSLLRLPGSEIRWTGCCQKSGKNSVRTVANTIFPYSLWEFGTTSEGAVPAVRSNIEAVT